MKLRLNIDYSDGTTEQTESADVKDLLAFGELLLDLAQSIILGPHGAGYRIDRIDLTLEP